MTDIRVRAVRLKGRGEKYSHIFIEKFDGRKNLTDLGVGRKIILKYMLNIVLDC
jgi:hypothetical protein